MSSRRRADVPIIYGYPSGELMEAAERGEVELGGCIPPDPFSLGGDVRAYYWTTVDGVGRWSRRRRPHRLVSNEPWQGVEFWYEDGRRVEGQVHDLSPDDMEVLE